MGLKASRQASDGCSSGCFGAFKPRVDARKSFAPRPAPANESPLSVQARIAARKGDPEALDLLPKILGQSLLGYDQDGRTLLFYAVRGTRDDSGMLEPAGGTIANPKSSEFTPGIKQGDAAAHLVKYYALDVNYQVHNSGMTPLMEATRYGNVETVAMLVTLGADPSLTNANGHTARDIAHMTLPEYLSLKEVHCSQNRWDAIKANIESDRRCISQILDQASSGSPSPKTC